MGILKEFRDFAFRGNVVDLAVAVIIGGAFGAIISSLVDNVITPLLLAPIIIRSEHLQENMQIPFYVVMAIFWRPMVC